uniref:Uncharacterized protein n=1 Tax=Anopheles atroparvus TaxID=41427 RepID=A0A182JE71_ANOAO
MGNHLDFLTHPSPRVSGHEFQLGLEPTVEPPAVEPVAMAPDTEAPPAPDPSAPPSSDTVPSTLMKQVNRMLTPPADLLEWKDMPQHLQFNPYVLTGYRPLQGVKGCLSSLFYVHNETINILTHGKYIPCARN